jgi:DNA-binding MarR family transcriptional regulator
MANSTVTVIVDYLHEADLVKRRRDSNDRRVSPAFRKIIK